jgi:hypothetical protein
MIPAVSKTLRSNGGETGIRTLGTLSSTPPFQGGTFNHSAISPAFNENITGGVASGRHAGGHGLANAHLSSRTPDVLCSYVRSHVPPEEQRSGESGRVARDTRRARRRCACRN